jgi:anti-sigma regulatory factor (Ser/Thr protein kinase)
VADSPPPLVRLDLPAADASGVTRARHEITREAQRLGLDEWMQHRIALAVTEACSNCVLHAYDGTAYRSRYVVEARIDGDDFVVVVQDWGAGIAGDGDTPRAASDGGMGLGLGLILTLSSSADVATERDCGTRVEMRFKRQ